MDGLVTIAILISDKSYCLPYYLNCILQQTYPKEKINLYIRLYNNQDNSYELIRKWVEQHGSLYNEVTHATIINEVKLSPEAIFSIIKQESLNWAKEHNSHYLIVDASTFIFPETLEYLLSTNAKVVAPFLKTGASAYSNYHYKVTANGYYQEDPIYYLILKQSVKGLVRVEAIKTTYLLRHDILDKVSSLLDGSGRHEYVIFSERLRQARIPQYLDNRYVYGRIIPEDLNELKKELWLDDFIPNPLSITQQGIKVIRHLERTFFPPLPLSKASPRVRILYQRYSQLVKTGLHRDAMIYHNLIPNSYLVEVYGDIEETTGIHEAADINLYLEKPYPSQYFPAKQRWILVNQEFLNMTEPEKMDLFLCKTHYAHQILSKAGYANRTRYLGHTSIPCKVIGKEEDLSYERKDPNLWVHFAGASWLKNTSAVIRVWIKNRGFHDLQPGLRLVVTSREICYNTIKPLLAKLTWEQDHWIDVESQLYIYPTLSPEQHEKYLTQASLFLCPSVTEGYGHYINEGLSQKSLVVTTNFPPMNELVTPESGLLVPIQHAIPSHLVAGDLKNNLLLGYAQACVITDAALEETLRSYFHLDPNTKSLLAQAGHQRYLNAIEEFKNNLTQLLVEAEERGVTKEN